MSKVHSTIQQFVFFKQRYRSANLFESKYFGWGYFCLDIFYVVLYFVHITFTTTYFLAFKVLFDQLLHLMPEQIEISIQYIKII